MVLVAGVRQQRHILWKIWPILYQNQRNFSQSLSNNHSACKLKCDLKCISLHHRYHSSKTQFDLVQPNNQNQNQNHLFDFYDEWPADVKTEFVRDMILIEDFISEEEEEHLFAETKKTMKRMRYQYDHWDDAIHGYREMEKTDWWPENERIFERVRSKAFVANVLPHVHILDLAADGIIKPHVDSSRYCGTTIAGLSLLTDCIMRLKRVDENQHKQSREGGDDRKQSGNQSKQEVNNLEKSEFSYFVDILLKRRSLYIMKDSARYKFSHEVLASKSKFMGNEVVKDQRISIICRNQA
ncbi:alpha-ketoglutarate-dependent dioxygenase alkB homolog 7, mitochondrial [Sitodiplosis mosellana]|uniref:alpha-ketoglutarate-dependent dioxygenase alkB homolog 7, mitochondrial n=1 Tax=Sitodiplosis mosellana TaxID=263140 RepID=UPI0024451BD8|nr:alpha-ketoglutarate-dependent dioxygenase alkB homolog 7, mitochondrial [Sitodiplosis mosellana]